MKGCYVKVTTGKYKVRKGAATETNQQDIELKNEILETGNNHFVAMIRD